MTGLGWGEILLVAGVALVVVGPERLPRLLRDLGRMYGQVRRAADDLRRSFVLEAERQDAEERYQKLQERRRAMAEARGQEAGPQAVPDDGVTVAEGTLSDDGHIGDSEERDAEADPNADDPEAPHPVQQARRELPR